MCFKEQGSDSIPADLVPLHITGGCLSSPGSVVTASSGSCQNSMSWHTYSDLKTAKDQGYVMDFLFLRAQNGAGGDDSTPK